MTFKEFIELEDLMNVLMEKDLDMLQVKSLVKESDGERFVQLLLDHVPDLLGSYYDANFRQSNKDDEDAD